MSVGSAVKGWIGRTGSEILGWILIPVGIVMMPAPGPGTLVLVGGVALLARRYVWAQRLLEPLERKAIDAAKFGVATWPRIVFSFLGGVWLVALGFVWWIGITIPEFEVADFTIPSWIITSAFWLAVALVSVGAVVVLRGLLKSGDTIRITIVAVVWLVGLWLCAAHTPDLSSHRVHVAFGPELPAQGWGAALGLWASAIAAWGLLWYSVVKWREPRQDSPPATTADAHS